MPKGGRQPGAGRPKGAVAKSTLDALILREALTKAVLEKQGPIIKALLDKATEGDIQAIKEVFDRVWGKARQPIDGGLDENDKPIPILSVTLKN